MSLMELFKGLQKKLTSELDVDRCIVSHPGTKGDVCELDWCGALNKFLPARYAVNSEKKAFVIDSLGNMSEQTDIVIFDRQYCPLLFHHKGAIYIPAESVYAVFEVKQTMDKQHIDYASSKAASVRRLKRTSVDIFHAGGKLPPKEQFEIIAGLLSYKSDWNPAFGQPFVSALQGYVPNGSLNIGCTLTSGTFDVVDLATGKIKISKPEVALVAFYLKLLERLQKLGTVPAIDLQAYSKNLWE